MGEMTKKPTVPAIRFKGFTDTWEQRKLGDIVTVYDGVHQTPNYQTSGVMFLSVENIATLKSNKFISFEDFKRDYKVYPQRNDILMTRIGDVGTTNVVTDNDVKAYYVSLALLKYKETNPFFLSSAIQSDFVQKGLSNRTLKTAIPMKINKDEIGQVDVMLPTSADEQDKIGSFFSQLDTLITLHQRKLDKLHKVKRSLLERMFPRNGANVPEIRFSGFTDAWEQRTVGVFYEFKNGLNKGKAFFGHGTPIVNFTDVFHNRSLYCKDLCGRVSLSREEINNFNVHKGDLFFTRTSETIEEIGYSSVMMDEPESTVFSGFVLRGRAVDDDPLENIFKSYVFFTDTFRKEMIMKSSMTTRALTSGTAIKKMLFYYPSDKTEQKRIGSLLEHLDRLITLHQRKLDKLRQIKRSMLEKMFV